MVTDQQVLCLGGMSTTLARGESTIATLLDRPLPECRPESVYDCPKGKSYGEPGLSGRDTLG